MLQINLDEIGLLATDWDESITSKDTLRMVGQAAYDSKPNFTPKWDHFESEYMKDYTEYCKDKYRETLAQEEAFLRGITDVEYNSVKRVESSGLFKDVPLSALHKQAEKVPIRKGWWDLCSRLRSRGIPIVIISVNWSAEFIRRVFEMKGYHDVTIYANEISMDENKQGTGKLTQDPQVRTAQDKANVIQSLRKMYGTDSKKLCYVGDSNTDLLALKEADIGIIIHKAKLLESCERLGLKQLKFAYQWDEIFAE